MCIRLTVLYFFLSVSISAAQTSLSGIVTDKETGEPIFGAHIFIENSTVGAISDPDGKYLIKNIRGTNLTIVVSHASYSPQSYLLKHKNRLNFQLKAKTQQLSDFELEDRIDRQWKRFYKQFEAAFFGKTHNADYVTVKNPWVMDLAKSSKDELSGYSVDLLQIDNHALGYHVEFLVEDFLAVADKVSYGGKPLFTAMEAKNPQEQALWDQNRATAYYGSKRHFLYALTNQRLAEEGFEVYTASFDQKFGNFQTEDKVIEEDIYQNGVLNFKDFLKVVYTKEQPEKGFIKDNSSYKRVNISGANRSRNQGIYKLGNRSDFKFQVSYLFIRSSRGASVNLQGFLSNPKVLLEYGYWSWERVAELLPYEYHLDLITRDKEMR